MMNRLAKFIWIFLFFTLALMGADKIVSPPWTPYPLTEYRSVHSNEGNGYSLHYQDSNKQEQKVKVRGGYWDFRYPSKTKESHQAVRQKIDQELLARKAELLYSDEERTLYKEETNEIRRYYDIYYGWNYEVRIYIYEEHRLVPNESQEINFEVGKENPQVLIYQADFDGEHYYYLTVDILEGEGVNIEASPDLEDEAVRIRHMSKLRCENKYYKHYSLFDLDPYHATHYFNIEPVKGKTKVKLTLVKTDHLIPALGEISNKAGLLKMKNSLSSLPKIESVGNIFGDFGNEADALPNGDAIYWLNNGYYTLFKDSLQTNLIPILANHHTTIDWPLFYEKLTAKQEVKGEQPTTKMAIYDVTLEPKEQVSVNLSLSHLPKDINLTKEDFTVLEAGTVEGKVVGLERLHQPMNVVILLDSSGSMKKSMKLALESVEAFIEKLPADAQITLVDFDTTVKPIPAKNRKELRSKLQKIKADGATALYDSLIKGVELLGDKSRASIVLFTDGKDANYNDTKQGSKATFDQMIAKVQSTHIPIYPIAFGKGADTTTLTTIAKLTKTTYYQGEKTEQLTQIFNDIANTLSSAYKLTYQRGKLPKEGSQSVVNYMVDVSGSQDLRFTMAKDCEGCGYRYEPLKTILAESIQALPKSSFVQLSVFNDKVKTLQVITQDRARLLAGVGAMEIGGGTDILKAIKEGFALSSVIPSNRRYFIFVTDAAANAFKFDEEQQKELKSALLSFNRSGIQTFWLGTVESDKAKKEVENLAKISGGEAFVSADIDKISEKILAVTQKVGENNATQTDAGAISVKLKRRSEQSGEMVVAVGEKAVDFPLLQEQKAGQKITDISYDIHPFDTNKESYNIQNAQKIYGDDTPLKEVQLSKIIPLRDDHNQSVSGQNRAVKIEMHTAYLFDRLKGISARYKKRFLVLDLSLENLLKPQNVVVLEDGSNHPSSWLNKSNDSYKTIEAIPTYKIPNLKNHLFIRVNNDYEVPFESITWALEKPLVEVDEHQLLVQPKVKKEGVLAFSIPDQPIETLSLHLYDTAYGHLDIPIIGTMKVTKEEINTLPQSEFTKMGENFALKVESELLQEQIKVTKAEKEAIFDIVDVTLQSNVNALLQLDASKRIFLKIQSDKGDYILPTHSITTALPMGLYQDIALAPGSNNKFKLAFHIPKALKENPKSLLVELKGEDVEVPIKKATLKADTTKLTSAKAEGIMLDLNGIYETPRGYVALDITLHDAKDGEATRLHDAVVMSKYDKVKDFATIVDKNQEIKADKKGLGSFSHQSELTGAYKWMTPESKTGEKIVGYEGTQVIYDGTSRRFVVLFDKNKIKKEKANYLISPIFKELSYKIDTTKLEKLPKALEYLLTEKIDFDIAGNYDKEVLALLKKIRAKKIATEKSVNRLPVVELDSPDQLAAVIEPLPISLYGAEKLSTLDSLDKVLDTLSKLEWIPAVEEYPTYSAEAILTQDRSTEYEMLALLYHYLKMMNVPIEMGTYTLTPEGEKALTKLANGYKVTLKSVPYIQWEGHTLLLPFVKSIDEVKSYVQLNSQRKINGLTSQEATIKMQLEYALKNDSTQAQIGGMASALGGGERGGSKKADLFHASFDLNQFSNTPIDIFFQTVKNEKGDKVLRSFYTGEKGVEHECEIADGDRIVPKVLTINVDMPQGGIDQYTYIFEPNQKIENLFYTFALAAPNLPSAALKRLDDRKKELFEGVKEMTEFSTLQWLNRDKIYKFIGLQSRYEAELAKTLTVQYTHMSKPRVIIAKVERKNNKIISTLDLREVYPDLYGDKNSTNAFNIMAGLMATEGEKVANNQGHSINVLDVWRGSTQNLSLLVVPPKSDTKKELIHQMELKKYPKNIQSLIATSDNIILFPSRPMMDQNSTRWGWLEINPQNYQLKSILDSGEYGSTTEYGISQANADGMEYFLGILAGVQVSVTSVATASVIYSGEEYRTIIENAEKMANAASCIFGAVMNVVSIGKGTLDPMATPSIVAGCVAGQSELGRAMAINPFELNLETGKWKSKSITGTLGGGFAGGIGDGITLYFQRVKK